jgi:magnesium transporter
MNFNDMPELRLSYGYPSTLATVVILGSYLYYRFKRAGWF